MTANSNETCVPEWGRGVHCRQAQTSLFAPGEGGHVSGQGMIQRSVEPDLRRDRPQVSGRADSLSGLMRTIGAGYPDQPAGTQGR